MYLNPYFIFLWMMTILNTRQPSKTLMSFFIKNWTLAKFLRQFTENFTPWPEFTVSLLLPNLNIQEASLNTMYIFWRYFMLSWLSTGFLAKLNAMYFFAHSIIFDFYFLILRASANCWNSFLNRPFCLILKIVLKNNLPLPLMAIIVRKLCLYSFLLSQNKPKYFEVVITKIS